MHIDVECLLLETRVWGSFSFIYYQRYSLFIVVSVSTTDVLLSIMVMESQLGIWRPWSGVRRSQIIYRAILLLSYASLFLRLLDKRSCIWSLTWVVIVISTLVGGYLKVMCINEADQVFPFCDNHEFVRTGNVMHWLRVRVNRVFLCERKLTDETSFAIRKSYLGAHWSTP